MVSSVRIGFIGCGGMASAHMKAMAPFDDAEIVGLCDVDEAKCASRLDEYRGLKPDVGQPSVYTDPAAMIADAGPDVLYILLPPFAHGAAERACLAAGKPFFVEKPVGLDAGVTREIAQEAEARGIITCAGYMNRYRAGVTRVREMLAVDPPVMAFGGWIGGSPTPQPGDKTIGSWWVQKDRSGGQLVEQTTHTVDLARYLCGEPVEVHALAATGFNRGLHNYTIDDATVVNIRFAGGAVADLYSCCAANGGGGGVAFNVYAHDATFQFTGWEHSVRILRDKGKEVEEVKGEPDIFAIEDRAFLDAVKSGDDRLVRSTYADAARTLALTLAANESMATGRPVDIE